MRKLCLLGALAFTIPAIGQDAWPQFRGPEGQGHSQAVGLPLTWSDDENVQWKVELPGLGWSSPSIANKRIWLTAATDDGRSLRALCLDQETGRLLFETEVFRHDDPGRIHAKNSYASPTPIIEDDRVTIHFGALGTACLSTENGAILWKTVLEYDHRHGPAGSPALYKDRLIINCDGYENQFVVALDKLTGEEIWRSPRDARHAYSTPLIINVDGQDQVISTGADRTIAYDPETGEAIWWFAYDGYSLVPKPVYGHGLLFICTGYNTPWVYAVRPTGRGDVTSTHVEWSTRRGAPLTPSPLFVGDELYLVSDRGVASCLDAKTGSEHWQQRLGGDFSASPTYADGRIYFQNETGTTTVIEPGTEFRRLARNQLPGRTFASYAIVENAIFLRTETSLYRLQQK